LRESLKETASYPDLGFEWYYWQRQLHLELKTLYGHSASVCSVAFSPDGQRIATGAGNTCRVWDAATGQRRLELKGHSSTVVSVAFSPDGKRILTGSGDATAKVWDATPQQVEAWQLEENTAAERVRALRHQWEAQAQREQALRSQDPGAIKEWLVLAPISLEGQSQEDALKALDQEQVPREGNLRPRAAERMKAGGTELVWTPVKGRSYSAASGCLTRMGLAACV
jgi:WD domain, G-beta repeat